LLIRCQPNASDCNRAERFDQQSIEPANRQDLKTLQGQNCEAAIQEAESANVADLAQAMDKQSNQGVGWPVPVLLLKSLEGLKAKTKAWPE
jgi:hypothetical protein